MPVGVTIRVIKTGKVSNLDKSLQLGLNMKDHPTVKGKQPKAEGVTKPKGRRSQQSTSSQKARFKAPMTQLEDKAFEFG